MKTLKALQLAAQAKDITVTKDGAYYAVTYPTSAKVYKYKGTIPDIAARLSLIDAVEEIKVDDRRYIAAHFEMRVVSTQALIQKSDSLDVLNRYIDNKVIARYGSDFAIYKIEGKDEEMYVSSKAFTA